MAASNQSTRIRGSTSESEQAAREMRRSPTPAEAALWEALRSRRLDGLKFRCQHALGPFILDFCCPAHRLVVELDGAGHDEPEQAGRDEVRTEQLAAYGYRVLRFRNEEVFEDLDAILARIRAACAESESPPTPIVAVTESRSPQSWGAGGAVPGS